MVYGDHQLRRNELSRSMPRRKVVYPQQHSHSAPCIGDGPRDDTSSVVDSNEDNFSFNGSFSTPIHGVIISGLSASGYHVDA